MPIRVLIVDDSSVMRGILVQELSRHSDIHIVDTASDGQMAIDMAKKYNPNVILLDLQMPIMCGLTALPHLAAECPESSIVVVSSVISANSSSLLEALAKGAKDFVTKPDKNELQQFYQEILQKIRIFGQPSSSLLPILTAEKIIKQKIHKQTYHQFKALAIASSTGGARALMELFSTLKQHRHKIPIFITQHMQANFYDVFTQQLSKESGLRCHEAHDNEIVEQGRIYIAPRDAHMVFDTKGTKVIIQLSDEAPINSCKPSADPMFMSLAKIYGPDLLAAVLTGMGQDGANGAKVVAEEGGTVIVQDMSTSVIYGMPKAVADMGICDAILPLPDIAEYIRKAT